MTTDTSERGLERLIWPSNNIAVIECQIDGARRRAL